MADFDFDNLDKDDITKGFDDGGDGELSVAEQERRQDAFQKEVQKNMEIIVKPKQYDANKRREAIRWLGEAGDPDALPALLKVYQKDKTPGMKEEAAYALGQFKALGEALDDPETQDEALNILDQIVLHHKFGKRANALPLILAEVGLVILAVVFFGVGLFFAGAIAAPRHETQTAVQAITETARPTATPDTEEIMVAQLQNYYQELVSDAQTYQFELAKAGRGDSINCSPDAFHYPPVYNLSPMWAGNESYKRVADLLNEAHGLLDTVHQSYSAACTNNRPIPQEEAISLGRSVLDAQDKLDEALAALNSAGVEMTEPPQVSSTPRPTEPATATATADLSFVEDELLALDIIISDMTTTLGPGPTLKTYWEQVTRTNSVYRSGCNLEPPVIPADHILANNNRGLFAELDSAADNVNTGLQLLRESSDSFYAMCTSGIVPADAASRLDQTNLAISAFNTARTDLNALRGR
jgi:hypothetical protein